MEKLSLLAGLGPNCAQWIYTKQLAIKYYDKLQILNGYYRNFSITSG